MGAAPFNTTCIPLPSLHGPFPAQTQTTSVYSQVTSSRLYSHSSSKVSNKIMKLNIKYMENINPCHITACHLGFPAHKMNHLPMACGLFIDICPMPVVILPMPTTPGCCAGMPPIMAGCCIGIAPIIGPTTVNSHSRLSMSCTCTEWPSITVQASRHLL